MDIKELYSKDINIQKYFRDKQKEKKNDINGILYSYDYQAGSYTKEYFDGEKKFSCIMDGKKMDMTGQEMSKLASRRIAKELSKLHPDSILEVGVGEATRLCNIALNMQEGIRFGGLELSLSRLLYAQRFASYNKVDIDFVMGDMFELPYMDNTFDIVLTIHCLESNTGREKEAIQELLRVAGKYVVMIEPSYEFGNEMTKKRIKELCYIDSLQEAISELKLNVIKNELFTPTTSNNNSAITIIKKEQNEKSCLSVGGGGYACPICRLELHEHKETYFCPNCFNLYPIIHNIPVLNANHAILCSKYETAN